MDTEKKNARREIGLEQMDLVNGGNKKMTEDTPTDICPLCLSEVSLAGGNTMAKHQADPICAQIRKWKGLA